MSDKIAGILGGLGPLATVYFMEMLIRLTVAETDQQHLNTITTNHAAIPDRTAHINGEGESPLGFMIADAQKLEAAGASFIVMPCNTSHYYYRALCREVDIPVVNIIAETVSYARRRVPGIKRLGVLATEGTTRAGLYEPECFQYNIQYVVPGPQGRADLMDIIYNQVKANRPVDISVFNNIVSDLHDAGCDAVVLGCTELSVIRRDFSLYRPDIVDSMEALALRTLELGEKEATINDKGEIRECVEFAGSPA